MPSPPSGGSSGASRVCSCRSGKPRRGNSAPPSATASSTRSAKQPKRPKSSLESAVLRHQPQRHCGLLRRARQCTAEQSIPHAGVVIAADKIWVASPDSGKLGQGRGGVARAEPAARPVRPSRRLCGEWVEQGVAELFGGLNGSLLEILIGLERSLDQKPLRVRAAKQGSDGDA